MSDLIKRSDAIKAVWGDDINPSEDGMVFEAQSHIDRDIRLIPSADRPQGEWTEREVFRSDDNNTSNPIIDDWQSAKCSVCGKYHTTPYLYYFDVFNYCPHCGARMKGADDE